MRRKLLVALPTVLILAAAPAIAEEVPEIAPLTTYFHCSGNVRAQNALAAQPVPTWNTTPPAASVQQGAGCGFADPGAQTGRNQENVYDAMFKGTFTGNLDSLTVRLHDMGVGAARTGAQQELGIRVSVDGDVDVRHGHACRLAA